MNHFTEKELEEFKKGSLPFPYFIFEESPKEITTVMELVSMSGMDKNKGIPTEISIYHHVKGKTTKRLTYKLKK